MKMTEKIRQYWHDFYYFFASEKGVKFAMTCKDVAEQIDIGVSKSQLGRFRFFLHISLCQGCKNYLSLTNILGAAIRSLVFKTESQDQLKQLNRELLEKHSPENNSKK